MSKTGIFYASCFTNEQKSLEAKKKIHFRPSAKSSQKGNRRPSAHISLTASWDMLLTALSAAWYAGLTILGFFGNLVVFLTISVDRKLHLKRYVILASLAFCDFLCAVLVIPFRSIARWKEDWVFGMPWCYATVVLVRGWYAVTIAHLCAISYDRWVALLKLTPHRLTTNVWLFSTTFTSVLVAKILGPVVKRAYGSFPMDNLNPFWIISFDLSSDGAIPVDIQWISKWYCILVYTTQVNSAFLRDLIGSSISGYQVLFTSWRLQGEKHVARDPFHQNIK